MGKPTGFLEFDRELPGKRDPKSRIDDYKEIYVDFEDETLREAKLTYNPIEELTLNSFYGFLGKGSSLKSDRTIVEDSTSKNIGRISVSPFFSHCILA